MRLLQEVIVPNDNLHTVTSKEFDHHIIVIDGGNPSNPLICAPEGVSISFLFPFYLSSYYVYPTNPTVFLCRRLGVASQSVRKMNQTKKSWDLKFPSDTCLLMMN